MASKFEMDPAGAESALSSADSTAVERPTSTVSMPSVGSYATPLMAAIVGTQAVQDANKAVRVATNTVSREFSVATVETTEATNSGALTT